jgi:Skp family chaperone for outer membrane proteins
VESQIQKKLDDIHSLQDKYQDTFTQMGLHNSENYQTQLSQLAEMMSNQHRLVQEIAETRNNQEAQ